MCLLFMFVGLIKLRACKHYKNKFEQGMINEFTVEAVDLGELKKLRIGHDNSGVCGLTLISHTGSDVWVCLSIQPMQYDATF